MNIVMTGATSGLGAVAAARIVALPDTHLMIGSRGKQVEHAEAFALDLSRLASVRSFAQRVVQALGDTPIDALVLNAGISAPAPSPTTEDGFESTFATNHLAHYLLLRLLAAHLTPDATVVVTTSDTHDPRINRLAPPRHAYPDLLARADPARSLGTRSGFRAYASSKLSNLLTARAFAKIAQLQGQHPNVVAYNPGFTPETGLNRDANRVVSLLARTAVPVARKVIRINTVDEAGLTLADLATNRVLPPEQRIYASLVRGELTWPDPSALARSDDAMTQLWQGSARLVGLDRSPELDRSPGLAADTYVEPPVRRSALTVA